MSGSGGGAGGGTGGQNYPAYMMEVHSDWLYKGATSKDKILKSVTAAMNSAMEGNSPYYGFKTINIDDVFLGESQVVTDFVSPYHRLDDFSAFDIESKYTQYMNEEYSKVDELIDAQAALIDDEILTGTLPRFQAGMDDINAVQSSQFVIGEALIWHGKTRELAKLAITMQIDARDKARDFALKRISIYTEWNRQVLVFAAELARMYAGARHDVDGFTAELRAKDKMFDLQVYQYGVNVMSSIHGSAVYQPDPGLGKSGGMAGALSGAASGAAMGAMMGSAIPGIGTAYGAAVGGAVGLAAGLLGN